MPNWRLHYLKQGELMTFNLTRNEINMIISSLSFTMEEKAWHGVELKEVEKLLKKFTH